VINSCAPDVAILEEAYDPRVVRTLAELCGMKAWGANRGDSLGWLSRGDVRHYAWHHLLLGRRRYLEIVPAAWDVRIFGVHLSAIHSNPTEWRRTFEARSLLSDIAGYREAFHLVTGDFNSLAPGEELDAAKLPARLRALLWLGGGRVRWRSLRLMTEAGYVDAYRFLHSDAGHTFPSWDPSIRLDYLFTPVAFQGQVRSCEVVRTPETREASDHLPLLAEVVQAQDLAEAERSSKLLTA
jgi:endonuclease/exonuclease/phosphatase family metal-dependent hydrolase